MRILLPSLFLLLAVPADAKWALSADTGAGLVMSTGLEGGTETVGPDLNLNLGYQLRDFLRIDVGAVLSQQGTGVYTRPTGLQGIRPAAKLFVFGGSMYGKASLPLTFSGSTTLGLLVGGGYELKLLGLAGGYVEMNTGYQGASGGVMPVEARAGVVLVW